jgi:tetratricopeptide (TPR) repeat protein
LVRFDAANQKIQEVRIMFPVNTEAGVLVLRIDQVQKPESFEGAFKIRFDEAVAGSRRRLADSYIDLQVLGEIYPDYPGMRSALAEARVIFNPPTVQQRQQQQSQPQQQQQQSQPQQQQPQQESPSVARVQQIITTVRAAIAAQDNSRYQNARTMLNEMFQLDPTNPEYSGLNDALQRLMGSSASIALDSESETLYQRALKEFTAGNNLAAFALVQQLMQLKPQNRDNTKVQSLARRIQAIL